MKVFWNNETIKIKNESDYQFFDRGFHFGDGIYETISVQNGNSIFLKDHIERLIGNAYQAEIKIPDNIEKWIDKSNQIIELNDFKDGFIKIIITRGTLEYAGLSFPKISKPSIFIWGQECEHVPLKKKTPYKLLISKKERRNPKSLITYIKTLNYMSNIIAKHESDIEHCDEAILLNTNDYISEGTTSNIFFINEDNTIITPSIESGILNGIIRSKIIEACVLLGFDIEEKEININEAKKAKGCFITSSMIEITPVSEIKEVCTFKVDAFMDILKKIDEKYINL